MTDQQISPDTVQALVQVLSGVTLPEMMPANTLDAAQWWVRHQEPPDPFCERPRIIPVAGSQSTRMVFPYMDRVHHTLRVFLGLSADDQRYVLAAHEDGVSWRGEPMAMLARVYDETQEFRGGGAERYIQRARELLGKRVLPELPYDPEERGGGG